MRNTDFTSVYLFGHLLDHLSTLFFACLFVFLSLFSYISIYFFILIVNFIFIFIFIFILSLSSSPSSSSLLSSSSSSYQSSISYPYSLCTSLYLYFSPFSTAALIFPTSSLFFIMSISYPNNYINSTSYAYFLHLFTVKLRNMQQNNY